MTRAEAAQILTDRDARLTALLDRLTPTQLTAAATIGGGDWSAKDLLGHVAFWEELALAALDGWRTGDLPAPREVDDLNAENQARSAAQALEVVRERAAGAHRRLLASIEAVSDADWEESRTIRERTFTLGQLLGGITAGPAGAFDHVDAHLADLSAYVESAGA
ncbi:MAG TPA: DinB family protein [Candidatus Dormibacteraeota bacterium]|jgi:uncharacterized damage-inducible protein DinB|nr:DinB family protein [Candidatus Dormibacteraeota bacterium]